MTRGHRFHAPQADRAALAGRLPRRAREGLRARRFRARGASASGRQPGRGRRPKAAEAVIDPAVLDEVTALTEWPVPLAGGFEPRFLELPPEVLVATMQDHQRYFPVRGRDGKLMPRFIAVANIESKDPAQVRAGNERVVRPRLADAAFFYAADRKASLDSRRARRSRPSRSRRSSARSPTSPPGSRPWPARSRAIARQDPAPARRGRRNSPSATC